MQNTIYSFEEDNAALIFEFVIGVVKAKYPEYDEPFALEKNTYTRKKYVSYFGVFL